MHVCIGKLTIIGSYNGLTPGQRQAIIRTNVGLLLIRTLGKNFSEIFAKFKHFHSRKCIWQCGPGEMSLFKFPTPRVDTATT